VVHLITQPNLILLTNTGGTFNVSALTDIFLTGATPNNITKTYSFANNTGGTMYALTDIFLVVEHIQLEQQHLIIVLVNI
jgi:hypothetical protein